MTTHLIVIVAVEARQQRRVSFTLAGSLELMKGIKQEIVCATQVFFSPPFPQYIDFSSLLLLF